MGTRFELRPFEGEGQRPSYSYEQQPPINRLANLKTWLGDGKWDVIHFNWGLHDLKYVPEGRVRSSRKRMKRTCANSWRK